MERTARAPHGQCAIGIVTGRENFPSRKALKSQETGKSVSALPAALSRETRGLRSTTPHPSPHRLGPVNGCVLDKPPSTGKAWPLT